MKFLLDMGLSPRMAAHLRQFGHDAVHLSEQRLETLSDPEIIEEARLENRILLTHDLDFGELMAAARLELPSVVTFRLRNMHPQNVQRYLNAIIAGLEASHPHGVMISVVEECIRIRNLPIE